MEPHRSKRTSRGVYVGVPCEADGVRRQVRRERRWWVPGDDGRTRRRARRGVGTRGSRDTHRQGLSHAVQHAGVELGVGVRVRVETLGEAQGLILVGRWGRGTGRGGGIVVSSRNVSGRGRDGETHPRVARRGEEACLEVPEMRTGPVGVRAELEGDDLARARHGRPAGRLRASSRVRGPSLTHEFLSPPGGSSRRLTGRACFTEFGAR